MSSDTYPPKHHRVNAIFVIPKLPEWLEWVKEVTGYSDGTLAICLGADPRQVERWRLGRSVPGGHSMAAIVLLAERIPGGYERLMYPMGRPPTAVIEEVVIGTGDGPPSHPPGDRAA